MTERLSVFFLLLALLLMQTFAGLHRGSVPVSAAQAGTVAQASPGAHAAHNLHDDLFGVLEGKSSCHLLDHLLEPPTATGHTPCVSPPAIMPARQVSEAPARISTFQLFGPPARGPPARLS